MASLAPLEVYFLQRDVPLFSSALLTPPPGSSPTCFPFLNTFLYLFNISSNHTWNLF